MSAVAERRDWLTAHPAKPIFVWPQKPHQAGVVGAPQYTHRAIPSARFDLRPEVRQRSTREIFEEMANQWKRDTLFVSSVQEKVLHPAYQRVIGLGYEAVPFIIRDLAQSGRDWFWALRAITGEDPVPEDLCGLQHEMVRHWLAWADARGLR